MSAKHDFSVFPVEIAMDFIKSWEGERLDAYQCSAGVWTIGVGHTKGVKPNDQITKEESKKLFAQDLITFKFEMLPLVKVDVTQGQFVALLSFVFNLGITSFKTSTLLKKLNQGDYVGASNEFLRWKFANGKVVEGLLNRRKAEKALFDGGAL